MILLPVLALLVLLQSLLLVAMGASAATARLTGDRRLAVEASAALETATARARVDHAATIAALPAGDSVPLPVTPSAGWTARAVAYRESGSALIRLVIEVELSDPPQPPVAAATGTLLLWSRSADTAIVIAERPRF